MRSSIIAAALALTFALTATAGPIPKDSTTKSCNKACTMDYKPICAQFKGGKKETFSNSCSLSVYQCENPKEVVATSCENPKEVVATSVDGTCDAPAEKKCNKACTMDYSPVCAQFDGGNKQTFGNSCSLSVYQCEHPEEILATSTRGSCDAVAAEEPKESKLAAEITQPIDTEAKSCNKACILLYDPVCAKFESGHNATFGNTCQLSVYQCENPRDKVAVTTKGSCEAL
ncbi:hypothetical protein KVV02_000347 [Mortierella alpina]|uniref:Uncharacterized protein n=1 Tax=Mortierella alpina TaxID=64518 RepID=A0A9P8D1P0_MORAP|nr:hypothetical protein KVV02_000347 [Mortierella alpina]